MKTTSAKTWILWTLALAAATACGILFTPARSACYFVTMLATVCVFLLTGVILATAPDKSSANSGLAGWPLSRICVGVILLQLIVAAIFVALSDRTNWLIPAVVECLLLTVDAAALSPKSEDEAEQPAEASAEAVPADKEGSAE